MERMSAQRQVEKPCSSATHVVCLSGQVRALAHVADNIAQLVNVFGGGSNLSETVHFLNLQDSGKGGHQRHSIAELGPALASLRSASVRLYNSSTYAMAEAAAKRSCFSNASGHWSHHFVQMWGIQQCLQDVLSREAACGRKYEYILRGRPDMQPEQSMFPALAKVIGRGRLRLTALGPTMWMGVGTGADRMMVLNRAALPALANITERFSMNSCGGAGAPLWQPAQPACRLARVLSRGTECFLITAMVRAGARVLHDPALMPQIRRVAAAPSVQRERVHGKGALASATNPRRMASSPSNSSERFADVTDARSLAICVVGQGRTFEQAAPNMLDATASLRRAGAEVLFVLDRMPEKRSTQPSMMKRLFSKASLIPTSKLQGVIAAFSRTSPTASDIVIYSNGLEESLVRCRRLLEHRERQRGARFAYVMRLRPDMVFKFPLPPLHYWPRAQAPTLFTDYITCGLVGSRCGATSTCPPSVQREHGLCADDNFGFMDRSVVNVYFGRWDLHPQCAVTNGTSHTRGVAARLGCIECKLGCAMFRRGIRVLEVANVSRQLVRSKEQNIPRVHGGAALLSTRTYDQATGIRVSCSASGCA